MFLIRVLPGHFLLKKAQAVIRILSASEMLSESLPNFLLHCDSNHQTRDYQRGLDSVIYIVLVNCHVLFVLTEKSALEATLPLLLLPRPFWPLQNQPCSCQGLSTTLSISLNALNQAGPSSVTGRGKNRKQLKVLKTSCHQKANYFQARLLCLSHDQKKNACGKNQKLEAYPHEGWRDHAAHNPLNQEFQLTQFPQSVQLDDCKPPI